MSLGSSRTAAYRDALTAQSKTPAMIAGVFVFGYK
ncbi:hypothetical protein VIBHAR_06096 [Vibrio campbellii ATCC BAA-1116]|uniref:Uncharacterized protein n=1 Tax=Vibrio campbellii (strain ATCC BAA-1116) TaxID=2902295 RepID=A7N6R1_VIBC1|nr:hypothetical protein VIBHAR_06096 [Vibrio campbellii ATCC BAA-1116]